MKKTVLLTIALFYILRAFAQPGNGCTKAITITPGTYKVDTMFAGANSFGSSKGAKWYKYTPTQDGLMTISSCGGNSDTRVFVYSGACDPAVLFAFNDDFCALASGDEYAAGISKLVKSNQTYLIEWDNPYDSLKFDFTLSFSANYAARPTQTCATATAINPGNIKVDSLFGFASRGDASRANWYKFTPTKNGKISLGTCGEDVDTRLWIYKGTCSSLVKIGESDDDCVSVGVDMFAASVNDLSVVAGTTYYFEWDDFVENTPFSFSFIFDAIATATNDEVLSSQIQISPNPAADFINLSFDLAQNKDLTIQILNPIGQVVFNEKYASILRGSENINVKDLKSGLYIVKISDGVKQTYKKMIVAH